MSRDRLSKLREEYYSNPDEQAETDEEVVEEELLALEVLFKSRAVTVSGEESITVEEQDKKPEAT